MNNSQNCENGSTLPALPSTLRSVYVCLMTVSVSSVFQYQTSWLLAPITSPLLRFYSVLVFLLLAMSTLVQYHDCLAQYPGHPFINPVLTCPVPVHLHLSSSQPYSSQVLPLCLLFDLILFLLSHDAGQASIVSLTGLVGFIPCGG